MEFDEAIEWLYALPGAEHKGNFNLSLKNITALLDRLNHPERKLKVVHVAGTNGKGSVCAMISSILSKAGYRAGTYLSPHVWDFRERLLIDGKKIGREDFSECFNSVKKLVTNQTFFEAVTAIAFLYFAKKKVEFLACETGLGGRLDATNVVNPLVSVITNIGIEHTDYLGKTIGKIAFEKAGIIKRNIPVVTGANGNALEVIKNEAGKKESPLYVVRGKEEGYRLALKGSFQKRNAAIAVRAALLLKEIYGYKIRERDIKNGLLSAMIPGRFSFVSRNVLVDCAHNPDAIESLAGEVKGIKKRFDKIIIVIGVLKDKDKKRVMEVITPIGDFTILTKPGIERGEEPKNLLPFVKGKCMVITEPKEAVKYARKIAGKNDLILVTGSFYAVREVRG